MKEIIWLDDNKAFMIQIINGAFNYLWDKEINCSVFLIGDDYKNDENDKDYDDNDIEDMKGIINKALEKLCLVKSRRGYGDATKLYEEKVKLFALDRNVQMIQNKQDENSLKISYEIINKSLNNAEKIPKEDLMEQESNVVKYIIEKTIKATDTKNEKIDDYCFAIDLKLFAKDDHSTISMLLYHGLISKQYKCFLYTNYLYDEDRIVEWKKNYNKLFDVEKDFEIVSRDDLIEKTSTIAVEKIINLFEKNNQF